MRRVAPSILLGLLTLGLWLLGAPQLGASGESEVEKVCAEAEARYQELFGDETLPEGVVLVLMYKYTFCPPDLEVKAGATLRWVNVDKRTSHSVWFKAQGKPESDRLFPDEFVEMSLDEAGRFDYICGPHGEQEGMRGSVTVSP